MTLASLMGLRGLCLYKEDEQLIDDYIEEERKKFNKLSSTLDQCELYYYYTFGTIHEKDREVIEKAFATKNFKLWDDCRIVYPRNLPINATLWLPNIDDTIPIKINPFSFSLIIPDGENG